MRHLPRGRTALALLLVQLLPLAGSVAGCRKSYADKSPAAGAAAGSSGSQQSAAPGSEAERTRAMEQKAKDIDQQARDIQTMQGTEQEKIDAVNRLEQQRQDLNRQSESAPPSDSSSPPAPPPPL